MITAKLLDIVKNSIANSIKGVRINEEVDYKDFNLTINPDHIKLTIYISSSANIDRIRKIEIIDDKSEILISRETNTVVNLDFYYSLNINISTKESRLYLEDEI